MKFEQVLNDKVQEIESRICAFLPKESGYQKTVIEAMNYSFLAGGKRLRPMLMAETHALFHGESPLLDPFMAALEMIHTYSLIHDDLPCMDNDDYRRGKPTNHIVFGEAMALLAGDALLNLAFETAIQAVCAHPGEPGGTQALALLADCAGVDGMIGGQTADVENEGRPISEDLLSFIYDKKTGALIRAAMEIGAILAGADQKQCEQIRLIAKECGLAFQIRDDILDVCGDEAEIGKPVGSDARNEKVTYVTLYGIRAAEERVAELTQMAENELQDLPGSNPFLEELLAYLIRREK